MTIRIIKIHNNHKDDWHAMLTYEKAACDHQVAEVLAGHQRDGALLLELPSVEVKTSITKIKLLYVTAFSLELKVGF